MSENHLPDTLNSKRFSKYEELKKFSEYPNLVFFYVV
uniref:Uncharacterized protein n=1 Tax=Rhizophora mucronata TaxID=61149 RepID=A0A2P2PAF5_RHIMU